MKKEPVDKRLVYILYNKGWSKAKIAKRFNVHRSRISRIIGAKYKKLAERVLSCEICREPIKKKRYLRVTGVSSFVVCKKCKTTIETKLS